MKLLFIDDIRDASHGAAKDLFDEVIVVRSSAEAITWLSNNGVPDAISFDHDLGGEDTAMLVVKWMITKDIEENGTFIPIAENFTFFVHSANPVGRDNILSILNSYLKFRV